MAVISHTQNYSTIIPSVHLFSGRVLAKQNYFFVRDSVLTTRIFSRLIVSFSHLFLSLSICLSFSLSLSLFHLISFHLISSHLISHQTRAIPVGSVSAGLSAFSALLWSRRRHRFPHTCRSSHCRRRRPSIRYGGRDVGKNQPHKNGHCTMNVHFLAAKQTQYSSRVSANQEIIRRIVY